MAQVKIVDIAQDAGVCPVCLTERIEESGILSFSSRTVINEMFIDNMSGAHHPNARAGGWVYYCDEHCHVAVAPDAEIEVLDVLE